ncbi:MAG: hypothetical protein JWQ28_938 [Pedobacter sp.]|jgi:hypothetical protein|nr:hypothetical protein [Pedobacter sp.]
MKTPLKTLFAVILGCVIIANVSTVQATETNKNFTTISSVKSISKIVVTGNVKLILIQASKESVNVYDNYYGKNALVQQQGNTLRISSFEKSPLSVVVFVNNLDAITASNESTVKTVGKFHLLNLKVTLQDQASADIDANMLSLFTSVKDKADLKLCGSADSHIVVMSDLGSLNMDKFVSNDTSISTASSTSYAAR